MEIWPNFFIVGASRSGTTSLYQYLKDVPGVYMSPNKEPNYFAVNVNPNTLLSKPIRDKKKYLKLFQGVKDETAIGDASPAYLWDPMAPKLIHEAVPNARIIMILRDPVERAFSHYLLLLSHGRETLPFQESIKKAIYSKKRDFSGRIFEASLYAEQVSRYLEIFGKERTKILIFEEFFHDTSTLLKQVLKFLGVQADLPESLEITHNPFVESRGEIPTLVLRNNTIRDIGKKIIPYSIGRFIVKKILNKEGPKPLMSQEDRIYLEELYRDDVRKLQNILGRSLPWPLAQ